ncbi:hypothetical protein, variant [Sphaeroforma arctica JP610]|uniref:PDZ domain-containing protein n=1 Tax=Sphaeroforma arctica JP610 TaxID=667725 RepID=A0A0L0GDA6_9EUKA|nr:hypothetical protein, variant [Sphaeroforma arctica JP610]KNC86228.1 hypothetical protein, variant [Sphaeroforma arctica JP610]|eukprot:XP_014160131.1 hypothetical protein, variant [Sphaeroforma arctica JP610]
MHPVQSLMNHTHLTTTNSFTDRRTLLKGAPRLSLTLHSARNSTKMSHRTDSTSPTGLNESSTSPPAYSGAGIESSPDLRATRTNAPVQQHRSSLTSMRRLTATATAPALQARRSADSATMNSNGHLSSPRGSSMSRLPSFTGHQQKHLHTLAQSNKLEVPQSPPARREVYVKKVNAKAPFGADIIRIDDDFFVAKVYESMDLGGEKTAAYRIGLSFGDRIVSINKLAVAGFPDLQKVLDNTHAMTVEYLGQPWFVNCKAEITKDHQLKGLTLNGRTVVDLERGSYADRVGVHKGFALISVDGESVLGESNEKVDLLMSQYRHTKQTHLMLMFTRESAWQTLVKGIELVMLTRNKQSTVSKHPL